MKSKYRRDAGDFGMTSTIEFNGQQSINTPIGVRSCSMLGAATIALCLAAGGVAAAEEAPMERCSKKLGTLAVVEPQSHVLAALRRYSLPAPTSLLRQFVQESGCFDVVERGRAMRNLQQERELSGSGMLQQGSNMGGGQMVTADFVMTPDVIFKDNNAGGAGVGAAVGSLFGGVGSAIGAIAGGVKFQEAQTSLMVSDTRSGIQVASASGTSKQTDWAFGGLLGAVGGGAYTSTDEGKVVAAALLDNYNQIVRTVKDRPSLLQSTSEASQRNASQSVQAQAFQPGALLRAKLKGAKILQGPQRGATAIASLAKSEEVVYMGEREGKYLLVQSQHGEGWVQEFLLTQ